MTETPQYKIYYLLMTEHDVHLPTTDLDRIVAICQQDAPADSPLTRSEKLTWYRLRFKCAQDSWARSIYNPDRDVYLKKMDEIEFKIEELMK